MERVDLAIQDTDDLEQMMSDVLDAALSVYPKGDRPYDVRAQPVLARVWTSQEKQLLMLRLPAVFGDRVRLQQVLINLMVNGIEAMVDVADRPRDLVVRSQLNGADAVRVAVQDAGVGLDPGTVSRSA